MMLLGDRGIVVMVLAMIVTFVVLFLKATKRKS
jgi:hypothetical protein